MVHLVGLVFRPLLVQLRERPGAAPSSQMSLLVPIAAPLPAGLMREKDLGGVTSLLRGGENLYGPALAAWRFAPAEVLHGVGAPLVVVCRVPVFWAQDGQKNAKQVFIVVHTFEIWDLGEHREPALNVLLFGKNRRDI